MTVVEAGGCHHPVRGAGIDGASLSFTAVAANWRRHLDWAAQVTALLGVQTLGVGEWKDEAFSFWTSLLVEAMPLAA